MDTVALVGRLLLSLAAVLCLMWFLARRFRNGSGRVKGARLIDVLGRQQVARNSSVAVIRVLDKALIVGVTDGQVSVLAETELAAVEAELTVADRPGARRRRPAAVTSVISQPPAVVAAPATPVVPATAAATAAPAASSARAAAERALATIRAKSVTPAPAGPVNAAPRGPLSGSALSPQTWRQTLDALRDLTVRTR